MTMATDVETPVQFGGDRSLFGLFLPASRRGAHAVLLCPPLGQDMIRSHRIYRQLARGLAAEGVPVLRFDYFGTGDSAGENIQLDWHRCLTDIGTAATELRTRSGCDTIMAFGARLGGSLAMQASASARFAKVVAWDPVLDGAAHVARQDAMQQALLGDLNRFAQPRSSMIDQWCGFPVPAALRQQLGKLQATAPAAPLHLLDSTPSGIPQRELLLAGGATVTPLRQPTPWDELERIEVAILSRELVEQASAALRTAH